MGPLGYKIKLWMINEKKEAVFGDGLAELIEEIDKYHSILAAAEHMDMSYRYALHRITLAEERLGQLLVIRVRGGAKGGGSSEVTDFGKELVVRYRRAQARLDVVLEYSVNAGKKSFGFNLDLNFWSIIRFILPMLQSDNIGVKP